MFVLRKTYDAVVADRDYWQGRARTWTDLAVSATNENIRLRQKHKSLLAAQDELDAIKAARSAATAKCNRTRAANKREAGE